MNRRRTIIGLLSLSALVLCAFAAPNAMAIKGTTAFTCKPKTGVFGSVGFSDEHCTKEAKDTAVKFVHEEIAPETSTETSLTNEKTAGGTTASTPTDIHFTIGGVTVTISCNALSGLAHFINIKPPKTPAEVALTAVVIAIKACKVTKPAKCSIKGEEAKMLDGGEGKTIVKEVEGKSEMYVEFFPAKEKPFSTFTLEGAECALNGITVEVKGSARANVTTNEGQKDGPILTFTAAQTEKTLKVGASPASIEATFTQRMSGVGGNPIAFTTTAF
jgi:hypothetical protein